MLKKMILLCAFATLHLCAFSQGVLGALGEDLIAKDVIGKASSEIQTLLAQETTEVPGGKI
jgi:hypothetical protein